VFREAAMNFLNLRPENAVSRAKSILAANAATSKQDALVALMSVIDQTKRKRQWTQDLEDVMKFIIDHCVEEGSRSSSSSIKEALIKYRQQTQQVHHQSLYEVVVHYISKSEEALRDADSSIKVDTLLDLETIESPEQVLANALRGETTVSTSARNMRLSFHWNTLKNVLDVLRNNSRLKATYLDTVKRSFDFCKKWNRREEFVKLCSDPRQGLHSHLLNIELQKDQDKSHSVKLNAADDLEVQIQVRVEQLRSALDMELFHEAVTGAEDIYGLTSKYAAACVPPYIMKRDLKKQIFESLAIVFFRSDAILFHTYFALRHFQLSFSSKKKSALAEQQHALQELATTVILGALCTHELSDRMLAESEADFIIDSKLQSMTGLLELSRYPRREMLFADIKHAKVLQFAPRYVQDLFAFLEEGFSPLTLGESVLPALAQLRQCTDKSASSIIASCEYVDKLEYSIISRLLKQLSRVYASISIDSFSSILKFSTFDKVESLVLKALSSQTVSGRIDHRARCINFSSATVDIDSLRQLGTIAVRLNSAIAIMPASVTAQEKALKERDKEMRQKVYSVLARNATEENKMMSQRKKWIECGKEQSENSAKEQKADVIGRQIRETESVVIAEQIRVEKEKKIREKLMEKTKELLDKLKSVGVPEDKVDQILALPVETLFVEGEKVYDEFSKLKVDKQTEEIKLQTAKLKQLEKRLEHTERARAEEERPLLVAKFEKHCKEMSDFYEAEALKQLEKERADWQISRENKIRFARLQSHADAFKEGLAHRNHKT
jgi:translation initiation factor 3 subunit A